MLLLKRIFAKLIDFFFYFILIFIGMMLSDAYFPLDGDDFSWKLTIILILLLNFILNLLNLGFPSQTVGKMIMGLRLTEKDKSKPKYSRRIKYAIESLKKFSNFSTQIAPLTGDIDLNPTYYKTKEVLIHTQEKFTFKSIIAVIMLISTIIFLSTGQEILVPVIIHQMDVVEQVMGYDNLKILNVSSVDMVNDYCTMDVLLFDNTAQRIRLMKNNHIWRIAKKDSLDVDSLKVYIKYEKSDGSGFTSISY